MAAASNHVRPAAQPLTTHRLHLRQNTDIQGLITSLRTSSAHHVHVECNDYLDHPDWHSIEIRGLLEAIGSLPHLRRVSLLNLGAGVAGFPLQLLTVLLEHQNQHNTEFSLSMEAVNLLGEPEDMEELAHAIRQHTSLRSFRLELSGFTYDSLSSGVTLGPLIEALTRNPNVEEMVIGSGDFVYFGQMESETLTTIGQSTSLTCCDLYGFQFSTEHLLAISNSLQTNTRLEDLCLDSCTLEQEGVHALSQLIRTNHTLKKLDLQMARRTLHRPPPSLLEIATALGENSTLSQLHLPLHDEVDEQTDATFAVAIESNCSLESLELSTTGTMSPTIRFYLDLNRRGRGRLLQNVDTITTNEYVEALAHVGGELSHIFYYLRSYPLLCRHESPGAGMSMRQDAKRKRVARDG